MKLLRVIFSSFLIMGSFSTLCSSAGAQKPAEKSLLAKVKEKVLGKKDETPVGQEIRPMTAEEVAALTPKPKEPGRFEILGKKVGSSVAEYVVEKIIPGYKQDLSVISKISDVLAQSAENLKKKSVELKKAFPEPNFKEAARILPEMLGTLNNLRG